MEHRSCLAVRYGDLELVLQASSDAELAQWHDVIGRAITGPVAPTPMPVAATSMAMYPGAAATAMSGGPTTDAIAVCTAVPVVTGTEITGSRVDYNGAPVVATAMPASVTAGSSSLYPSLS